MKIYLSGKIGGLDHAECYQKFKNAEHKLLFGPSDLFGEIIKSVINPMDLPHEHDKSWASYMLEDLTHLAKCDGIAMIKDWTQSPGAQIEHAFALRIGIKIIYLN